MNLAALNSATWEYRNKTAQLISNQSALITIKFSGRLSEAIVDNRRLRVERIGCWRPEIRIIDHGSMLLSQRTVGFWGFTHEVRIGNRHYLAKSSSGSHYRVTYMNADGKQVVSYDLNSWQWKPRAIFRVNANAAPATDLPLLLIAGYLTLRKLKRDAEGSVAILATAG